MNLGLIDNSNSPKVNQMTKNKSTFVSRATRQGFIMDKDLPSTCTQMESHKKI